MVQQQFVYSTRGKPIAVDVYKGVSKPIYKISEFTYYSITIKQSANTCANYQLLNLCVTYALSYYIPQQERTHSVLKYSPQVCPSH